MCLRYADEVAFDVFASEAIAPKHWVLDKNMQSRSRWLLYRILSVPDALSAEEAALELLYLATAPPRLEYATRTFAVAARVREYVNTRFSATDDLVHIAAVVAIRHFTSHECFVQPREPRFINIAKAYGWRQVWSC